jgi:mannose-6-phosphate isomerase-like protein (cupin superfamily)
MPGPDGDQYDILLRHGTMTLGLYAPRGSDPQKPHTRDELYVVMRGSGWFRNGDERHRFAPGDVLFVPARVEHRFEEFTDDLALWVVFYGPEGGELNA